MHGYKHDSILVKNIFSELSKISRDFTFFSPKFIRSNPQMLLLFRLQLGLDQEEFASLIGKAKSTVSYYENCKSAPTLKSANKILNKILSSVKLPLNEELIISRFQEQKEKSKGFSDRRRAIELAYESNKNWKRKQEIGANLVKNSYRTEQEKMIENALKKHKIDFISQAALLVGKSRAGAIIADFLLNDNKKIVVESTEDYLDFNFAKQCKRRAMLLAYRGFRIKKYFPDYYTVIFLSQDKINGRIKHILKEAYDKVILGNDINTLVNIAID